MAHTLEIQPEDFYSERPPERIMAAECEYGLDFAPPPLQPRKRFHQSQYQRPEYQPGHLLADPVLEKTGYTAFSQPFNSHALPYIVWLLDNAACVHVELQQFIEFNAPESLGAKAAAATDTAGIEFMNSIADAARNLERPLPLRGIYRRTGAYVGGQLFTSGHHLNFLIPADLPERYGRTKKHLQPFLGNVATNACTWAGVVSPKGYLWSQKALGIGGATITYHAATRVEGKKPMLWLHGIGGDPQDHDIDSTGQWGRAELRMSDGPISRVANYLSFASSSLALRIAEHWKVASEYVPLLEAQLSDPIDALHATATSRALDARLHTIHGTRIYPDQFQEALVETVKYLGERIELPPSEQAAIELWELGVQAMRTVRKTGANGGIPDIEQLSLISDTGSKLLAIRRKLARLGFESEDCLRPELFRPSNREDMRRLASAKQAVADTDTMYHKVDAVNPAAEHPARGTGIHLITHSRKHAALNEKHIPSSLVQHVMHHPQPTRAADRAAFLREWSQTARPEHTTIRWNGAQFFDRWRGRYANIRWNHPYGEHGKYAHRRNRD